MATPVTTIVTDAFRALGWLGAGETASGDDLQLGLRLLNRLIGAWSTDRLLIYSITRTTFTLVSGTASYTVGTGGTINIPRPANMNGNGASVAYVDTSQSPVYEMGLTMLTDDTYQAIVEKTYESTYPTAWYYNPTYTSAAPYGTLTFWPVPDSSTLQGVIYSPAAVQTVALTDSVALPPEYERFLVTNLAMECVPYFTVEPSAALVQQARESKGDVERTNTRLVDLNVDLALRPIHSFENFYTGGN